MSNTASTQTSTIQQIETPPMTIRADYVFIGLTAFFFGITLGAFLVLIGAKASRIFGK